MLKVVLYTFFLILLFVWHASAYELHNALGYSRYDCFGYTFFNRTGQIRRYSHTPLVRGFYRPDRSPNVFNYRQLNEYYKRCLGWGHLNRFRYYQRHPYYGNGARALNYRYRNTGYFKRLNRVMQYKLYQRYTPKTISPVRPLPSFQYRRGIRIPHQSIHNRSRW
jgi:hypothetical protein